MRQACGPGKHSRYAAEYRAELGNLMICFLVFQLLRECMNQGSPVHPWPQVAAELGNLEETREKKERGERKTREGEKGECESVRDREKGRATER